MPRQQQVIARLFTTQLWLSSQSSSLSSPTSPMGVGCIAVPHTEQEDESWLSHKKYF
jgi:hypothetical protein